MSTMFRLFRLVFPFRWQAAAAVVLGVATVGAGIGLMGTAAFLIATAALQPSIAELQVAIVGVRFFGLSRGVLRYLERLTSHRLTLRLLGRLRVWFYEALEPLAPAGTMNLRSADLLSRAVSDVESLQDIFVRTLSPPLVAIVIGVGTGAFLFSYDPRLAEVFLVVFAAAGIAVPVAELKLGRAEGRELTEARVELSVAVVDGIQGMADLLAFNRGDQQRSRLEDLSWRVVKGRERSARAEAAGTAAITLFTHLSVWVIVVLAIPMVRDGGVTGVDLAVMCLVAMAAFEAVQPLPAAARHLGERLESASRIFAVLDAKPEVSEPVRPVSLECPAGEHGAAPTLELHSVGFTYPGSPTAALVDLDCRVAPGHRIAIVGPSGAGKSTVAYLMLRCWDPSSGEIQLDGIPIADFGLAELRETIGVLGQRTDLFTGTVRSNLLLARPTAEESDLERVAHRTGLLDMIQKMPEGLNTWIGEQGLHLSGGQRRRLAISRLMLRDPSVIVLDEPTSGLDPVSERRLMGVLLDWADDRPTVVITHRLVAMERFDEILVLDQGRVVERGSHDALLRIGGLYLELWRTQNLSLVPDGGRAAFDAL